MVGSVPQAARRSARTRPGLAQQRPRAAVACLGAVPLHRVASVALAAPPHRHSEAAQIPLEVSSVKASQHLAVRAEVACLGVVALAPSVALQLQLQASEAESLPFLRIMALAAYPSSRSKRRTKVQRRRTSTRQSPSKIHTKPSHLRSFVSSTMPKAESMVMRAINPAHLARLLDLADSDSLQQERQALALPVLVADYSASQAPLLHLGSRRVPLASAVAQQQASSDPNRKLLPSSAAPRQPQPHLLAVYLAQVAVDSEAALVEEGLEAGRVVPISSDSRINRTNQLLEASEVARLVVALRRRLVGSAAVRQAREVDCSETVLLLRPRSVNSRALEPRLVGSASKTPNSRARRAEASLGRLGQATRISSKSRVCLAQLQQQVLDSSVANKINRVRARTCLAAHRRPTCSATRLQRAIHLGRWGPAQEVRASSATTNNNNNPAVVASLANQTNSPQATFSAAINLP